MEVLSATIGYFLGTIQAFKEEDPPRGLSFNVGEVPGSFEGMYGDTWRSRHLPQLGVSGSKP